MILPCVKAAQNRFRLRLIDAKAVRLATVILPRHEAIKAALEAKERPWKAWQAVCRQMTCPECGERLVPAHEKGQENRCCKGYAHLPSLLRRLAGIHRVRQHTTIRYDEWADALKGLAGPRGCGPASWENAVRAWEDG